jgi:23S rRNA pseudouridine1911/1915/1917 synthase
MASYPIARIREPEIIYEDKNFLAVNKPAGWLVHQVRLDVGRPAFVPLSGTSAGKEMLDARGLILVDWLVKNYPEVKGVGDDPENRPGIVHRLDRDTSGVMIVAKNQNYFNYLKNLFQARKINKTYLALVYGIIKEKKGVIDKPISLKSGSIRRTVFSGKMAKEAITDYKVLKIFEIDRGFSLLEILPKTGRTHQIRVHLKSIGHGVVNDKVYKQASRLGGGRLMLHARSLIFEQAPGEIIEIEAEPPEDFMEIINSLESKCR